MNMQGDTWLSTQLVCRICLPYLLWHWLFLHLGGSKVPSRKAGATNAVLLQSCAIFNSLFYFPELPEIVIPQAGHRNDSLYYAKFHKSQLLCMKDTANLWRLWVEVWIFWERPGKVFCSSQLIRSGTVGAGSKMLLNFGVTALGSNTSPGRLESGSQRTLEIRDNSVETSRFRGNAQEAHSLQVRVKPGHCWDSVRL